jgi:hypothetical protein
MVFEASLELKALVDGIVLMFFKSIEVIINLKKKPKSTKKRLRPVRRAISM